MATLTISPCYSDNESKNYRPPLKKEIETSKRLGEYLREKRQTISRFQVAVYPLPKSTRSRPASLICEIKMWEQVMGRLRPRHCNTDRQYLVWLRNQASQLGYIPIEWTPESIQES